MCLWIAVNFDWSKVRFGMALGTFLVQFILSQSYLIHPAITVIAAIATAVATTTTTAAATITKNDFLLYKHGV